MLSRLCDQNRALQGMHEKVSPTAAQTGNAQQLGIARWFRGSMLLLLPVALWIWLCRDWPARLGFYSDDWMILLHPFPGTARAFHDVYNAVITRPVSAPYIWLAQLIVDWSPARSQLLNAAMLLVCAGSLGLLAAALVSASRLRGGAMAAACVASASFIVFPSSVGTFAWGTGVSAIVPALPLFCLAMSLLLHSEGSLWRLVLGLLLALLSHLSYEAFYFQEISFALLAAALGGSRMRDVPWRVLGGALIINVGCVAFNRLTLGGNHKTFSWDFLHTFTWGYSHIDDVFRHATREHDILIGVSVLGAAVFGSICLARIVGFVRVSIATLVVICGIVASGFLYAFAGYGLAAEGTMARVSIVLATYYSIVAGVLAAAVWGATASYRVPAIAFCLCAAIGFVALGLTARSRVGEWADTWTYETARLARLPVPLASPDGAQRIYLAIEDKAPSAVEPATAPWEIPGAVAWASYKLTNSRLLNLDLWQGGKTVPRWFATPPNWFNRWNGHSFEQGPCGSGVAFNASGTELWLWKTSGGTVTKVEAPWEIGCQ
jgi:hypothetical protein